MSTRCNIIIKDGESRIYLYHHHDGYPMGVGTELQAYLEKEWSTRRYWFASSIANELIKGSLPYPFSDDKKDEEYEVTFGLHGDIEYCYVINCQARTLRCYAIGWDDEVYENFNIRFDRVFRRRYLREIPTLEDRRAYVEDWKRRRAAL